MTSVVVVVVIDHDDPCSAHTLLWRAKKCVCERERERERPFRNQRIEIESRRVHNFIA
jgi:hypothetical protein